MTDPELIRQTVSRYFAAGDQGSASLLQEAFHPCAMMYWAQQGELLECSQSRWQERLQEAGPRPATERHLERVEVAGDSACAVLTSLYPTHTYHDAVLLLKLQGHWQIVAKVFHKGPPGGERPPLLPWDRRLGARYHPRAQTFTVRSQELASLPVSEGAARLLPEDFRIVRVDGAADIALVELERPDRVMDQLLMVHLTEGWRIVGLVYVPVGPGERLASLGRMSARSCARTE
jgi:hypothetical protein